MLNPEYLHHIYTVMLKIALIYILATSLALVQSSRKEVAVIIGGYQGEAEARVSAQGAAAAPEEELGVNEFVEIWSPSPDSCVEDPSFPLYSHIFNYGGPQVEMETNLREV